MSLQSSYTRASLLLALGSVGFVAGCSGDDNASPVPDGGPVSALSDAGGEASRSADGSSTPDASDAAVAPDATTVGSRDAGSAASPLVSLSANTIDFGEVGCGTPQVTETLIVTNTGGSVLAVSVTETGPTFAVSPSSLTLAAGASGALTVTANVPASATAGSPITGSLSLFTNDPNDTSLAVALSVTPTGATLTGTSEYTFASSEIGVAAPPLALQLANTGNAPGTFSIAPVASIAFAEQADAGVEFSLNPGETASPTAVFTPTGSAPVIASALITATGVVCGSSLSQVTFTGSTASGVLTGWPSSGTLDFGLTPCGGAAPVPQTVTLTNGGTTAARITAVDTSGMGGFGTNAAVGSVIAPSGGALAIQFTAPAVAAPSSTTPSVSLNPVSATVVIHTDADPSTAGTSLTLTEEPEGAVLAFDTLNASSFGNFGSAGILLQSTPPQSFGITNAGNASANITVVATESGGGVLPDGGGITNDSGVASAFSVSTPNFTIAAQASGAAPSEQDESISFRPVHGGATTGSLALTVASTTVICQVLPAPLPLSGSAIGGGPIVTPTLLTFPATCGGPAPGSQTFVVSNNGTADLTWTLGGITGPGAAIYSATTSTPPGLLTPGASSTVMVTATAVASPAPNPNPAALAAQLVVTTDVPLDPPHVVNLSEVPLGDQLSVSVSTLRFGQVSLDTSLSQTFTVTNGANPGSSDANVQFACVGAGAAAYSGSQPASNLAAGSAATETVTFDPTSMGADPATLSVVTSDPVCAGLPGAIVLSGTGTAGSVSLSASTLAFGQPGDPYGLVNCGSTGTTQTLTISNAGNQPFNVTSVTLSEGSNSPFAISGVPTTAIAIGGSATITVVPSAIPAVSDPNNVSAFTDRLTIMTDAAGDTPHVVPLAMQARGAVIADTPLSTTWNFGTVGAGSIGTFSTSVRNTGNAPATVTLQGLTTQGIFGLQSNPTTVPPASVTALVGQFSAPSASGNWTDQGQLQVSATDAFCAALPSQWMTPTIDFSGSSNASPVATISGSLVFPTTDCGGSPPGGQSVTLTNSTNQQLPYTIRLSAGTWYTFADSGSGMLAPNGVATIVVNPKPVSPGQGVLPGSAPYADELIIDIASLPATDFTVPISWTLNGAVLSLPQGGGPDSDSQGPFYAADSTSGFSIPMANAGTASATVNIAIQPLDAFGIQPAPPIQVLPNIQALPELVSSTSDPACPATTHATATFVYSGPVCQPFPAASVNVRACVGTYEPAAGGGSTDDGGAIDGSASEGGLDAGIADSSVADATVVDATTVDAGLDSAHVEAGGDGPGNASPLTACTTAGETNCITCPNRSSGVCSRTEAAFVQLDIASGSVLTAGPDYAGSPTLTGNCLSCLVAGSCLDDPIHGVRNRECDDIGTAGFVGSSTTFTNGSGATVSTVSACLGALDCMTGATGQQCAASAQGDTFCYCGVSGFNQVGPTACSSRGANVNGACLAPEVAGFTFPQSDANDIINNYTDTTGANPSGIANQILNCAQGNGCNACLQ
jgi:HYDIN/CFA65/VesB family protein